MPSLVERYATPLLTGLFLVSLVSGVARFFHLGAAAFKGMHEWLSMVLILPFVPHLWKNWRPMSACLKRLPMALSLGLPVAAAAGFVLAARGGGGRQGSPQVRLMQTVLAATPGTLAPVLGLTGKGLVSGLKASGLARSAAGRSLHEIALASGKSDAELAAVLLGLGS